MCVHTDLRYKAPAIVQTLPQHAPACSVACHSVNRAVRLLIQPASVFNISVSWVFTDDKRKNTMDGFLPIRLFFRFIDPDKKLSLLDIPPDQLRRRVSVYPLHGIPFAAHMLPTGIQDLYGSLKIFNLCFSYDHTLTPFYLYSAFSSSLRPHLRQNV